MNNVHDVHDFLLKGRPPVFAKVHPPPKNRNSEKSCNRVHVLKNNNTLTDNNTVINVGITFFLLPRPHHPA